MCGAFFSARFIAFGNAYASPTMTWNNDRSTYDSERPMAWRNPRVFAHLVAVAKTGRTVVAKAGLQAWRVYASGEWGPTV